MRKDLWRMAVNVEKLEQISVFLENRPGVVADLCNALTEQQISIRAMTVLDTIDIGTMRMVVDEPDRAKEALRTAGAAYVLVSVLGVEIPNRAGAFGRMAHRLAENAINIEYVYATVMQGTDSTLGILRVDDASVDRAMDVLRDFEA